MIDKIKVLLDEKAFMPERAHDLDAGYDLRTPYNFSIAPADDMGDGWKVIDTGVHIAIPEGYVGFIKSKSGLNIVRGLTSDGTIDAGYTGSIRVKLYNHTGQWAKFERGDKISQLVILPIITPELVEVEELEQTERGEDGFGSTGR